MIDSGEDPLFIARLMKDLGYGKNYQYDPDTETGFSGAPYFPDGLPRQTFYEPTTRGCEKAVTERLRDWEQLRNRGLGDTTAEPGTGWSRAPVHSV